MITAEDRMVEHDEIQLCGTCGLPTITTYKMTFCSICHQLLCATCQDAHGHNFGRPEYRSLDKMVGWMSPPDLPIGPLLEISSTETSPLDASPSPTDAPAQ